MDKVLDTLPPAREIPQAFGASMRSWWHAGEKQSAISEERLLRRLPFYRPASSPPSTPTGPITATSSRVFLRNPAHYLNTLSITSTQAMSSSSTSQPPPPAVLLHGYGAGLGFFFNNLPALGSWAAKRSTSVYALDWLGMGRSARPSFSINAKKEDIQGRVEKAESFFINSLEEWREAMGLTKMTLIGHSLGAYFTVAYALKYPDRVNKLILLSPAGVPRGPNWTDPSRELVDVPTTHTDRPASFHKATKKEIKRIEQEKQETNRTRRLLMYLWEEGWSPFQVIRSTLFWSPLLIGKYSSRRFPTLTLSETRDIHDYILNITLSKGSGEYCVSHILEFGAYARMPLVERITKLPKGLPVTFVYGDQDWMDPAGGFESVERLRQAGNPNGKMYIISDAGHHLYLDNSEAVNELLLKELDRRR